jgi:hypothetical protein
MSDEQDGEEWATSAEYRALQKQIADNEAQELEIRKRMDDHDAKEQAHRAAGRLLSEQHDKLRAELRVNHAAHRDLRFKLSQTEP